MAAPSKTFTIIADSAIDADSPLTADLMEDFRNNDIHLEEWLGLSYTAAQDHDHDGVNSAVVDISSILDSENAQGSVDVSGGTWGISVVSLGFTPQAMIIHWAWEINGGAEVYCGWGLAVGTGAGDQCGMSQRYDLSGTPVLDNIAIDSDDIMGYNNGTGGGLQTSFDTEQARVVVWGAGDQVTIQTQTGAWDGSASTIYINIQIWGA